MNEEERRRHKERRKRQKKRRNERKREEAKQARIADRQKRIEAEVEVDRVVQKCIERGELVRVRAGQSKEQKAGANDEPRGPARPVNNEGETSR